MRFGLGLALAPLMLGWLAPSRAAAGEDPPSASAPAAGRPLVEIRREVAGARSRVRSLLIEYLSESRDPKTGRWEPTRVRRVVVADGPRRFVESTHSTLDHAAELDLERNQVIFDGKTLVDYHPALLYCERFDKQAPRFAWKARYEFFFECTGWWPPDDRDPDPVARDPFLLHEALADNRARVLPRLESVGGAWCYVVERPGLDKWWLDSALGFAPRQREWRHSQPAGRLARYQLSDHREVVSGVWLPWRLHRVVYERNRMTRADPLPVIMDAVATVLRVEANGVPAGRFRFNAPPGTLLVDKDTDEVSQVPGGLSFLDVVVDQARRRSRDPGAAKVAEASRASGERAVALVYSAAGVVALLTVLMIARRRVDRGGRPGRAPGKGQSNDATQ